MEFINISHRRFHKGTVHSSSSAENDSCNAGNILLPGGYWSTKRRSAAINEYVIADFGSTVPVNYIRLTSSSNGGATFPNGFRVEGSCDGQEWKALYSEANTPLDSEVHEIHIPVTLIRYIKLLINDPAVLGGQYFSEIGMLEAGISGVAGVEASSAGPDCGPEKMLDGNSGTYWETEQKQNSSREYITVDLGNICYINRIVMAASSEGFPESFHFETSLDNEIWITLLQEKNFVSEHNRKYYWDTGITAARFLRMEAPGVQLINRRFALRLGEMEIFSAPVNYGHTHNIGEITPHASVFQAGMVRLARDGESIRGAVVQSTDSRLRDASNVFKGIVQLANDGDSTPGLAVQASDKRLQQATEVKPGTVRLAYNRETNPNAVVQANDSRLQHANEDNFGIVRICPDGEYKEHSVVSGNDTRIQKATTESFGISKLSEDGASESGTVVQANDRRLRDATQFSRGIVRIAEDGEVSEDAVVLSADRRLKDATVQSRGIVELAEDGEDSPGVAVQGNDRRLKDATTENRGIVELAEDGEDRPGVAVQGNDRRLRDATTESRGIVELAEDGEDSPGVAVQGNDRRLKDATETSSGIMKFAVDGGSEPLTAVQGNDIRLGKATTLSKGIVELAEDGEDSPGVAVQGNDRRLRDATTESRGIVELAEDGEDRPGVAVQGNDRRLKDATTERRGIVELAEDGEDIPGVAVQGNDRRLKDATETSSGIMKFAVDGGEEPLAAVQGNDKRLRDATTITKGIVELAEDGEDRPGVAVQGNDRRLKEASESDAGIVRLAGDGDSGEKLAVQASDSRLYDKREPLPHEHDYASVDHEYNSHSGTIAVRELKNEIFKDIVPPSDGSSVIYGNNISNRDYSIGITGISAANTGDKLRAYGVLGHSSHVGVRGQAPGAEGSGAGVLGASRFGAGGIFCSEHGYSLVADGSGKILNSFDGNIQMLGNGKALLVSGQSEFNGKVELRGKGDNEFPGSMVELFEVDEVEYVSPGDILVVNEKGGSVLSKSRSSFSRSVVGIVSGNPCVIINNSGKEEKVYPVILAGKALCKVDARRSPVNPGDLIVSSETAGCGMAGKIDSFDKIGTVVGKALDRLEDGVDLIPVFVMHM